MKVLRTVFCALLFVIAAAVLSGCATDNPDNISSVPWNQPADWEGPMPSTINQGR
jgi:type IV pilus biogenesis protein CpaD/CtpE